MQTKMMRPSGQDAVTDPQQKMMNQMMTFMPLLVVVFGWGFASGPVLYWVTQSVYSVVQQWFITGWGSLHDWVPGLPELPEHRRLGYRPPRDLDEIVVMSGEEGFVRQPGIMGWIQSKMHEQNERAKERRDVEKVRSGAAVIEASSVVVTDDDDDEVVDEVVATSRSAKSTSYQARVDAATKRPATTNRSSKSQSQRPATQRTTNAKKSGATTTGGQNGATNAPAVPRKSRPPKKEQSE
jgi:YidC/Oxa1 family membrane protein insertase